MWFGEERLLAKRRQPGREPYIVCNQCEVNPPVRPGGICIKCWHRDQKTIKEVLGGETRPCRYLDM